MFALFLLLAGAGPAAAQQYGATFRSRDAGGAATDRVRIETNVNVARSLFINSYIDANGQRIQNVGAPTARTDAATKAYVDALVAAAAGQSLKSVRAGEPSPGTGTSD